MLLKLYDDHNSPNDLIRIAKLLNDGGLIIYPTDTVYAIGCHGLNVRAIERICRIKDIDPRKHNLSIVCSDLSMVGRYAKMNNDTFRLLKRYLPGPFTFILPTGTNLPQIFKNRKEVGIRIPDTTIIRDIVNQLQAPVLTTSLPYDGSDDIEYMTNPELIDEKWGDTVDLIIDGGIGGTEHSTIVDCTESEHEILRQGKGVMRE